MVFYAFITNTYYTLTVLYTLSTLLFAQYKHRGKVQLLTARVQAVAIQIIAREMHQHRVAATTHSTRWHVAVERSV